MRNTVLVGRIWIATLILVVVFEAFMFIKKPFKDDVIVPEVKAQETKSINDLEVHESMTVDIKDFGYMDIIRVENGWIYFPVKRAKASLMTFQPVFSHEKPNTGA